MITYPAPDELMNRYMTLANTQHIENIARYAFEWDTLAADARAKGQLSRASAWQSRADFYKAQAGGEYVRLIDGSFSELIQVTSPRFCPRCEGEVKPMPGPHNGIYDCGVCETMLFDSEVDDWKGQTKGIG
jgi:hypothetical protein